MAIAFNADEIFEVAERIEINGNRFYTIASERASHAPARVMLLELAGMEERHLQTFRSMRAQLTSAERKPTAFDPEGDAALYLKALADERVFDIANPSRQVSGQEDLRAVLTTAIGFEKDSIAFYVGMMELVPPELGKLRIAEIIKEEMRHVTILSRHLAGLQLQPMRA